MTFNIKDYDEEDQARMEEFGKWKTCSKCGEDRPRSWTEFHRDGWNTDGLNGRCKACKNSYNKKYYVSNERYFNNYSREYYITNKEKAKEYSIEYRNTGGVEYPGFRTRYSPEDGPLGGLGWEGHWEEAHIRKNGVQAEYRRNNPEILRRANQRRRARLAELPHTLTIEEWRDSLDYFEHSCSYCGEHQDVIGHSLHQEHVIPVAKEGGYIKENIIPACQPCNASKNARDMEDWYREQPFFTEEQLHKIKDWQKDSE